MIVKELLRRSLRLFNGIAVGEPLEAEQAQDALAALNDMLDAWSVERLLVYSITRRPFTLAVGQQIRTIGVGGNFNVARPVKIQSASILIANQEVPINVIDDMQWQELPSKTQQGMPTSVWYDHAFPLGNLSFYNIPDQAYPIILYTWDKLAALTDINADISLPPGYARALRYNLAIDMAPEADLPLNAGVAEVAIDSKEQIKRLNQTLPVLKIDAGLLNRGGFNINTGAYGP